MKPKKSAFANTSTGYGRHKHSGHGKGHAHGGHKDKTEGGKSKGNKDGKDQQQHEHKEEQEKDLNSGFGDYLRTPEAFEMMKLFVFANTIMLIVTMAWPHLKEQFYMLSQWWISYREQQ
ncbi:GH23280 [Drosophila grimshawi]|uniref:GH23280 n=1 Tax=Drosophila grimshawi TaxID=7222 RepID=B4JT00_DROGR|nr:GH23280 [Drosophila grimshawi]